MAAESGALAAVNGLLAKLAEDEDLHDDLKQPQVQVVSRAPLLAAGCWLLVWENAVAHQAIPTTAPTNPPNPCMRKNTQAMRHWTGKDRLPPEQATKLMCVRRRSLY